jgi:hypothetical protein
LQVAAVIGVALPGYDANGPTAFLHTLTGDAGLLGRLLRLAHLDLDYTAVTGDLSGLGGCTALVHLDLDNTAVIGDVDDLGALAALRYLALDYTAAAGWPLAVAGGCTFADATDYCGGHSRDEYNAAYDRHTGLPKDGGAGYTC